MKGEITMWIEIPVEVTFEYDEGEKRTMNSPGSPTEVGFLFFDSKKALDNIDSKIRDDNTFDETCLNEIEKKRKSCEINKIKIKEL